MTRPRFGDVYENPMPDLNIPERYVMVVGFVEAVGTEEWWHCIPLDGPRTGDTEQDYNITSAGYGEWVKVE